MKHNLFLNKLSITIYNIVIDQCTFDGFKKYKHGRYYSCDSDRVSLTIILHCISKTYSIYLIVISKLFVCVTIKSIRFNLWKFRFNYN